jgi:hypothetical protein
MSERIARLRAQPTSADSKVAAANLYTEKTPITAPNLLNDRVLPLF